MVGYRIENTLTENGYVSRGICEVDGEGMLRRIPERVHIEPRSGGAAYIEEGADEVFIGKSMGHTRPYSEETAAEMDAEIRAIIDAAYQQCREILARYKSQLTAVAEYLLENETMDAETFETYFADGGENGESRV